jgi:hypothetical protein
MASRRRVTFSDYALMRMHQRDILEEEVLAALDRPPSAHKHRPDGRIEVKCEVEQRPAVGRVPKIKG